MEKSVWCVSEYPAAQLQIKLKSNTNLICNSGSIKLEDILLIFHLHPFWISFSCYHLFDVQSSKQMFWPRCKINHFLQTASVKQMESTDLMVCAAEREKLISMTTWLWTYPGYTHHTTSYNPLYIAGENPSIAFFWMSLQNSIRWGLGKTDCLPCWNSEIGFYLTTLWYLLFEPLLGSVHVIIKQYRLTSCYNLVKATLFSQTNKETKVAFFY